MIDEIRHVLTVSTGLRWRNKYHPHQAIKAHLRSAVTRGNRRPLAYYICMLVPHIP